MKVCSGKDVIDYPPNTFLVLYSVVWTITLLGDIIAYTKIINYMRLTSVRIDVIPDTLLARKKVVNIVTGSSRSASLLLYSINTSYSCSLLIWLVTVVTMLPSLALSWDMQEQQHRVTTQYQILAVFVNNCVSMETDRYTD